MKRILSLLASAIMVIIITGCSQSTYKPESLISVAGAARVELNLKEITSIHYSSNSGAPPITESGRLSKTLIKSNKSSRSIKEFSIQKLRT